METAAQLRSKIADVDAKIAKVDADIKEYKKNYLEEVKKQERFKNNIIRDVKYFMKLHDCYKIKMEQFAETMNKTGGMDKDLSNYFYLVLGYVELLSSKKVTFEEFVKSLNSSIYT